MSPSKTNPKRASNQAITSLHTTPSTTHLSLLGSQWFQISYRSLFLHHRPISFNLRLLGHWAWRIVDFLGDFTCTFQIFSLIVIGLLLDFLLEILLQLALSAAGCRPLFLSFRSTGTLLAFTLCLLSPATARCCWRLPIFIPVIGSRDVSALRLVSDVGDLVRNGLGRAV